MPQPPINRRHEFLKNYFYPFQAAAMSGLLDDVAAWFRGQAPDAYNDWHRDPLSDDAGKIVSIYSTVTLWYRSHDWGVFLWAQGIPFGPGNLGLWQGVTPEAAFTALSLEQITLTADDVPFFPALNFVLVDLVRMWLENDSRSITAAFSVEDAEHWRLDIGFSADAGSRWPDEFSQSIVVPFEVGAASVTANVSYTTEAYTAHFQDSEGKPATVPFRAKSQVQAREIANAIAGHSDAQWIGLRRYRILDVPSQDVDGNPAFIHFNAAAGAGSSVADKGRFVYRTAVPSNTITLEIPSVNPGLLSKGSRRTTVDPLSPGQTGSLLSENGAPATQLRAGRFFVRGRE